MPGLSDIRYAVRFLIRTPAFTLPAVASLALGIAVNAMMFSLVNATLLRPLGTPAAGELVRIGRSVGGDNGFRSLSVDELATLREHATSLTAVMGEEMMTLAVTSADGAETVAAEIVTGNYFDGVGVVPALGRGFNLVEERPSVDAAVVVLSDRFWRRRLGADDAVVGRTIAVNNTPLSVVGVAPADFTGTFPGLSIDLWIPLGARDLVTHGTQTGSVQTLQVMGRLRETTSLSAARAELRLLAQQMADRDSHRSRDRGFSVAPARGVHPAFQGPARLALLLLMVAVGLVLLVACANVASLQLARGNARRQEIAIRTAVGATRQRLVGQLLIESGVLALAGGGVGLLLALWPTRLLDRLMQALGPDGLALSPDLRVDGQVLLFTSVVSVATAVVFGLVPALRVTRLSISRAASHVSVVHRQGRSWWRGSLTIAQVAVSTVLLISASLIFRSLHQATSIDVGFRPDGVVVASFADQRPFGHDRARIDHFHDQWLTRVRASLAVESAAFADFIPLAKGTGHPQRLSIPGRPDDDVGVSVGHVSEGYFALLGQTVRGRDFTVPDRRGPSTAAIINEALARRFWPGEDAIGKRLRIGEGTSEREIVGIVRDGRYTSFADQVPPLVFLPGLPANGTLHVRTHMPSDRALAVVRQHAFDVEPQLPPFTGRSLRAAMASSLVPGQIVQFVLGCAGAMVLLLSAGGLYGLVRYAVEQRKKEIGIRIALGATSVDVFQAIAGRAMCLTAVGVALGTLAGAAATRVMTGLLYGLTSMDPLTFTFVAALLLLIALAAGLAALRAGLSRNPVALLRSE